MLSTRGYYLHTEPSKIWKILKPNSKSEKKNTLAAIGEICLQKLPWIENIGNLAKLFCF